MTHSPQVAAQQRLNEAAAVVRQSLATGEDGVDPTTLLARVRGQGVPVWDATSAVLRLLDNGELVWGRDRRLRCKGRRHDDA